MTDSPKFRVILSGVVLPEKSRAEVLGKLAALFHSRPETMEKLLHGKATPLTREYQREQAEKICRAIVDAGAECRVEEILGAPQASEDAPETRQAGEDDSADDAEFSDDAQDAEQDAGQDDEREDESAPRSARENQQPYSAMLGFVAVNTEYYARQFAKFNGGTFGDGNFGNGRRPSFALTWHWPAFFLFFFWAVYRKLWLWAGVNLAGGVVLALLFDPGFLYLAWALLWPITANYLYFRHVRSRVFGAGGVSDSDDNGARGAHFTQREGGEADPRGGVSRAAVGIGMAVMFLLSVALNNHITERMVERYFERAGEVLPGPGSRQRGDGSAIDDIKALPPKAAKTVAELSVLAVSLKLAASNKGLDDSELVMSAFERVLVQKVIKDAWGNKIAVRRDAAGQAALVSAGPDGEFGNADDILQYIRFDSDSALLQE